MHNDDEALTPAQAEQVVKRATNKVASCTAEFRKAGEALVVAKREYRIAEIRAYFDPNCPVPSRSEGVTVAAVEMFVKRATAEQADALHLADINRETALEALRSARNELQGAMAVNASVREAYKVVGVYD